MLEAQQRDSIKQKTLNKLCLLVVSQSLTFTGSVVALI